MNLRHEIIAEIKDKGPMSMERYMQLCLAHPHFGYYMKKDPFGLEGDFITAPEVSQVFGELLALWAIRVATAYLNERSIRLIELGAGRGSLACDILRTIRKLGFDMRFEYHIVEHSPCLTQKQKERLEGYSVTWHTSLDTIPKGPSVIVANEFFDALAGRQYIVKHELWWERCVGLSECGTHLIYTLQQTEANFPKQKEGSIAFVHTEAASYLKTICSRMLTNPTVMLVIDYGFTVPVTEDTLQALSNHRFVDPLQHPGDQDLTFPLDWRMISKTIVESGCICNELLSLRNFLIQMGIHDRFSQLMKHNPILIPQLKADYERLISAEPTGMGEGFQVLTVRSPIYHNGC